MSSPRELLAQLSPRSKKRKGSVGSENSDAPKAAVFVVLEHAKGRADVADATSVRAVTNSRAAADAACKRWGKRNESFNGVKDDERFWASGPPYSTKKDARTDGAWFVLEVEEHAVETASDFAED